MGVSKPQNNKERAIFLRQNGLSFSEIANELEVSKGAISKWLKDVQFSVAELQLVAKKIADNNLKAHNKSRLTKQMKRVFEERETLIEAQNDFKKFKNRPLFLSGLSLYWAQGSLTNSYFQFTSSDAQMLKIMINWLEVFLKVKREKAKYRLFLSNLGDPGVISNEWEDLLLIPRANFMKPVINKSSAKKPQNGLNKGSIQIVASGIGHIRKIKVWQKMLIALLS
ncbi:MAG: hypothetical protein Q7R65_02235 [bacterium]|nr:hypothetical protein [bacterium]